MTVRKITREALHKKLDTDSVTLVEALPLEAYRKTHLPGALHLPQDEVDARAPELLPDTSAEIVVYCANASCSASAAVARRLHELGYTNVADYHEGKADWQAAGLPVESSVPAGA